MNQKSESVKMEAIVAFKLNINDKNYYESIAKKKGIKLSALIREVLNEKFDFDAKIKSSA